MEAFFGSIANILGEYFMKLVDVITGKKKKDSKEKPTPKPFVPPDPSAKPAPWTRKR